MLGWKDERSRGLANLLLPNTEVLLLLTIHSGGNYCSRSCKKKYRDFDAGEVVLMRGP